MSKLDYLGLGRVYGDRDTRDLVVDTDSIRRGEFAGDEEFSGRNDDWDEDDDWGDDDHEFGNEVEGEDGVEGDGVPPRAAEGSEAPPLRHPPFNSSRPGQERRRDPFGPLQDPWSG